MVSCNWMVRWFAPVCELMSDMRGCFFFKPTPQLGKYCRNSWNASTFRARIQHCVVESNVDERTRYGLTRHCLIFDFFKPVEIMLPREWALTDLHKYLKNSDDSGKRLCFVDWIVELLITMELNSLPHWYCASMIRSQTVHGSSNGEGDGVNPKILYSWLGRSKNVTWKVPFVDTTCALWSML